MQPLNLKLKHQHASILCNAIKAAYFTHNEKELAQNKDFDTLLILSTLRPFYLKLTQATTVYYVKTKTIKLQPNEAIALFRLFYESLVNITPNSYADIIINDICTEIHLKAITKGEYLRIAEHQQATELIGKQRTTAHLLGE